MYSLSTVFDCTTIEFYQTFQLLLVVVQMLAIYSTFAMHIYIITLNTSEALKLTYFKSPLSLMSFCSLSYFPANDCYFACASFHIPVLFFPPVLPCIPRSSRFVPHFSSQNSVEHTRSRSLLQCTYPASFYGFYPFLPCMMYLLFLLHFLISYFPCLYRMRGPRVECAQPHQTKKSRVTNYSLNLKNFKTPWRKTHFGVFWAF